MRNLLLLLVLSSFVYVSGCNKEATPSGPDNTSGWVGTYSTGATTGLTEITVSKAGNSTIKIVIKVVQDSYIYTATTLQNVSVNGTSGSINEVQNIIEATNFGPYNFNGAVVLQNNAIQMTATAVSVQAPNNENSPMNFTFSGKKVN